MELKPCFVPDCGSDAVEHDYFTSSVYCKYCKASGPVGENSDEAKFLWNSVPRASQWISVGERLPETGYRVLTYNSGRETHIAYMVRDTWIHSNGWDMKFFRVTHWQPLPEPPKEGE